MFRFFVYSYFNFFGFQFWWVNLSSLLGVSSSVYLGHLVHHYSDSESLGFLKLRVFSLCVNANFRCTRNELISTSFSTFLRSIFLLNAIIAQATVEFSDHPLFCAKSHCFRISEFEIVLGSN